MSWDWKGRKCLVTGGAGFGGAHLCGELLGRGAKVFVLDRHLPAASYLNLEGLAPRLTFLPGDVCDQPALQAHQERHGFDVVFHLAAQPLVPLSNAAPAETLAVNVQGTYAVLETVRLSAKRPRLVVASSGAYYGTTTTDSPISESAAPGALANVYAASKVAADAAVRCYATVYGIQAVALRFMNTYGPGDWNLSRLVPRALHNLLCGGEYDFGDRDDGTTRLDFLHIRDMARAYVHAAERADVAAGEAVNVGTGQATAVSQLAARISELYDGRKRTPKFRGRPKGRTVIKYLDTAKAAQLLNWAPTVGLDEGLTETIAWYRKHAQRLKTFAVDGDAPVTLFARVDWSERGTRNAERRTPEAETADRSALRAPRSAFDREVA